MRPDYRFDQYKTRDQFGAPLPEVKRRASPLTALAMLGAALCIVLALVIEHRQQAGISPAVPPMLAAGIVYFAAFAAGLVLAGLRLLGSIRKG